MIRVVLDTNIIVSALLNPHGVPAQLFRLVLNGSIRLCVDERILNEYYDVLTRPKFTFPVSEVNDILVFIEEESDMVTAQPFKKMTVDPYDQIFVEAAVTAGADFLVTGNLKHFSSLVAQGIKVVSPKHFLDCIS